jgi:hypothetical protein
MKKRALFRDSTPMNDSRAMRHVWPRVNISASKADIDLLNLHKTVYILSIQNIIFLR